MKTAPRFNLLALIAPSLFCLNLSAAPLTWDITSGDAATITDGGGTWTTSAGNWNSGSGNVNWTIGDTATFTGATGGAITVDAGGVSQSGMTFNGNANYAISGGSIGGAGKLTKNGNGTLTLSASNGFTGGIDVTGGELYLTTSSGIGSNAITLSGNSTLKGQNHGGTVSSFGSGTITVSSGATATITHTQQNSVSTNNYVINGATTFKAEGIGVGGAYFGFHNNISSTVTGAGPITLQDTSVGGGAVYWSLNSASYTGSVSIADGSEVVLFNGATLGSGSVSMGANTYLRRSAGGTITLKDLASGYTTSRVNDSVVVVNSVNGSTYAGKISGGTLTKNGTGTLTLTGTNDYTGKTAINVGTLQFGKKSSLYNNTPGSWTAANITAASGATLALNVGGTNEFASGDVDTLLANISVTSSTTTGLQAGAKLGFDTTTATGSTFTQGNAITDSTGTNGGAIGLTKLGTGTLVLDKTNTYSGATDVNGGKLVITGNISTSTLTTVNNTATLGGSGTVGALNVASGGTLEPGTGTGILTVTGNIGLLTGSTLSLDVNDAAHDRLNVTGSVSLAGLLNITTASAPAHNSLLFVLVNDGADAIGGTFSNAAVNGAAYAFGGQTYEISYSGDSITSSFTGGNDLVLRAIPEPGAALLGSLGLLALLRRRRA